MQIYDRRCFDVYNVNVTHGNIQRDCTVKNFIERTVFFLLILSPKTIYSKEPHPTRKKKKKNQRLLTALLTARGKDEMGNRKSGKLI